MSTQSATIFSPVSASHNVYGGPHTATIAPSPGPTSYPQPAMMPGGLAITSRTTPPVAYAEAKKPNINYGSCDDYEYPDWYCKSGYHNHEEAAMGEHTRANVHKGVNFGLVFLGILLLAGLIVFLLLFLKRNHDANSQPELGPVHVRVNNDTSITVTWDRDDLVDTNKIGVKVTEVPPTDFSESSISPANLCDASTGSKTVMTAFTGIVYVTTIAYSGNNTATAHTIQKVALQTQSGISTTDAINIKEINVNQDFICSDNGNITLESSTSGNECNWRFNDGGSNRICLDSDTTMCLSINSTSGDVVLVDTSSTTATGWSYLNNYWCDSSGNNNCMIARTNGTLSTATINPLTVTDATTNYLQRWYNPTIATS